MEFKPGDVVSLKSGGNPMTVEHVGEADMGQGIRVFCVWKETVGRQEEVRREAFVPATLRKWEPSKPIRLMRG
jgi:uncharacterized protein YodC (DUF2158 family)